MDDHTMFIDISQLEAIDPLEEARYEAWLNEKDEQLSRLEYLNALPNSIPSGWHG